MSLGPAAQPTLPPYQLVLGTEYGKVVIFTPWVSGKLQPSVPLRYTADGVYAHHCAVSVVRWAPTGYMASRYLHSAEGFACGVPLKSFCLPGVSAAHHPLISCTVCASVVPI